MHWYVEFDLYYYTDCLNYNILILAGLRFGKLQTKVGLISLLRNHEFFLSERTPMPLELDSESFTLSAKGNLWLKYKKITK